jgi:hypothetical protein
MTLSANEHRGAEPDSLRRSARSPRVEYGGKEGARGGTMGSPTLEGGEEWIGRGS